MSLLRGKPEGISSGKMWLKQWIREMVVGWLGEGVLESS